MLFTSYLIFQKFGSCYLRLRSQRCGSNSTALEPLSLVGAGAVPGAVEIFGARAGAKPRAARSGQSRSRLRSRSRLKLCMMRLQCPDFYTFCKM